MTFVTKSWNEEYVIMRSKDDADPLIASSVILRSGGVLEIDEMELRSPAAWHRVYVRQRKETK